MGSHWVALVLWGFYDWFVENFGGWVELDDFFIILIDKFIDF
jgi:hypothetical protein